MGSRRIRIALAKKKKLVNHKRVVRIMRKMGIAVLYTKPRTTITDTKHKTYRYLLRNLKVIHANQAWAIDITYIPMKKGVLYLVAIIDWHIRKVLS